jgi:hypothetical protein
VAGLMGHNPFEDQPPEKIRVLVYRYRFTDWGEEGWWKRERLGVLIPPVGRDDPALERTLEQLGFE